MASLSLVDSGPSEHMELGSKEWADKTRQETKALADNIERNYLKLAENLWELFDRPVNNDRKQANWLTHWNYETIGEFAEKELGIHRRIAERLRRIWAVVKIDCALEQSYLDRFVKVGRSKARLLTRAGVMNVANAKSWIERAEKLTYLGLEIEVNIFLSGREGLMKGTLGPIEKVDSDGDVLEDEDALAEAPMSPVLQGKTLWQITKDEVSSQVNEASGKSLEPEEKPIPKHFSLFPDQMDTLKAALERASELSGSSKDGQNLSLIALDFLATNQFKIASLEQTQRFFKRIEDALEVKLVVLSKKDHEILYGYKVLDKINND